MIAIIGAGASGLVAAIMVARNAQKVKIFEKNTKIGRKILATGNGRCNVTNKEIKLSNYHGLRPSFVNSCINTFNAHICQQFFSQLGIEMTEGHNGRLYPKSLQSSSIVELLVYECKRLGVEILCDSEVLHVEAKEDKFVLHVNKKTEKADKVLIATGGLAMPTLGSCDSGYKFAKSFGHKIVPTHASLVQLVCKDDLKSIAGVKIDGNIEVFIDNNTATKTSGDILFTNYGISGSAVLDISRVAGNALFYNKDVHVIIDLLSEYSKERLKNILLKRAKQSNGKSVALWLDGFINSKLGRFIEKELHVDSADDLTVKHIIKLVYILKNFKLKVIDTKGFKSAEVTAGGVNVAEVNASTLESKLQKNLYFSGEVLDIDADCGGYNLHWAWSSGYCVGKEMSK